MERPRASSDTEPAVTFCYVGRAGAAPVLARALRRFADRGPRRVAALMTRRSGVAPRAIEGSLRRCHDWLIEATSDSRVGIMCVAPDGEANALEHNGLATRGHLSLFAFGSLGDRPVAERLADLIEEHWIPPLHLSVSRAMAGLEGDFHLIATTTTEPDRVVCTSRGSTLCLGMREDGVVVCTEANAVLADTSRVVFLQSGEIGVLDSEGWDLLAPDALARLRRPVVDLGWYHAWARSRTLAPGPYGGPVIGPDRAAEGGPRRQAQAGR